MLFKNYQTSPSGRLSGLHGRLETEKDIHSLGIEIGGDKPDKPGNPEKTDGDCVRQIKTQIQGIQHTLRLKQNSMNIHCIFREIDIVIKAANNMRKPPEQHMKRSSFQNPTAL